MTSLYSCFSSSPYSVHVVDKHIYSLLTVSLNDSSLYSSTVYILTHNVLLASPGRAQKSKQNHNKLLRCSLHHIPNSSPFLTHICTVTHSLTSRHHPSCKANQIPWPIYKPVTKDPIATKLNHFLDHSFFNLSHAYPNSHVQCTCLPAVLAANTSKRR